MTKKLNVDKASDKKVRRKRPTHPCLAHECEEQTTFPICPLHYHSLLSGKATSVKLKNGYGDVTYNSTSQTVIYPPKVPENRLSAKQLEARVGAKAAVPLN
jgi:hypothetical protein